MLWGDLPRLVNAAIVGIFPRFRYVLFTPTLIEKLSEDEVEAILRHEIGHNRYRHLPIYPLLMIGLLISLWLFDLWSHPWLADQPALTFVAEVLLITVYMRFILSYFSRLFERQADLYTFENGGNPQALISALDHLAVHGGHIHDRPNWHHGSIRSRMNFLSDAINNPSLIQHHQRRVRWSLLSYAVIVSTLVIIAFAQ
jgi:STE24 endopeptidase